MPSGQGVVTVKLLDSDVHIRKGITGAMVKHLRITMRKALPLITQDVRVATFSWIYDSRELEDLRNGNLRLDLGLTMAQASDASNEVAKAVADSIIVTGELPKMVNGRLKSSFRINIQPNHYGNIPISLHLVDWGQAGLIPWLDILLFRGDEIIVKEFDVNYTPGGRSGGAKMKEAEQGWGIGVGEATRVNPSFSGTAQDNFISRALLRRRKEILQIFQKRVED